MNERSGTKKKYRQIEKDEAKKKNIERSIKNQFQPSLNIHIYI